MDASEKNEMKEKEYNRREEKEKTRARKQEMKCKHAKKNKQKLIQLIKTASNIELNCPCY